MERRPKISSGGGDKFLEPVLAPGSLCQARGGYQMTLKESVAWDRFQGLEGGKVNRRRFRRRGGDSGADAAAVVDDSVPDGDHVVLEIQGRVLRLKSGGPKGKERKGGGRRRACNHFSRRSRRNALEKLERCQWPDDLQVLMLTLTYPRECWGDWELARDDLKAFQMRFRRWCERNGYGAVAVMWKKEPFPSAPDVLHFHLMVVGVDWIPQAWVRSAWAGCIGADREPICKVESARSSVAVGRYLADIKGPDIAARYLAKADWGEGMDSCLVSSTKQHGGRWWGFWNPEHLPWGEKHFQKVKRGPWMRTAKRTARRLRCAKLREKTGRKPKRRGIAGLFNIQTGFSVFMDRPERMVDVALMAIETAQREGGVVFYEC